MKNNKKIILTGIIASPLFCGSCDNENSTQDNDFERIASIANKNSAIPLNTVGLEPNYFKLLTCIVTDIINEPTEAENFSKNPIEYCSKKVSKTLRLIYKILYGNLSLLWVTKIYTIRLKKET